MRKESGAITPDQETEEEIVFPCRRRARARELHSFVIQRQSGSDHSCFVIFPVCPPPCLLASPLICNQGEYPRQGAKAQRRDASNYRIPIRNFRRLLKCWNGSRCCGFWRWPRREAQRRY